MTGQVVSLVPSRENIINTWITPMKQILLHQMSDGKEICQQTVDLYVPAARGRSCSTPRVQRAMNLGL